MQKNRWHRLLNNANLSIGEGWLSACEGWMNCGDGRIKMWDGLTVSRLMNEIEIVHGRLITAHTSEHILTEMRREAEAHLDKSQFTSEQVRELIISAMGMTDTGYLYTRSQLGLEAALEARARC